MKRLMIIGVSLLTLMATATPIYAQINTTPFNLVTLAERGYFKDQGIPSYNALVSAYQFGVITAQDIVRAGVQQNRLAAETLNDQGYLRNVDAQLQGLQNPGDS